MASEIEALRARLAELEARSTALETRVTELDEEKRHYQWLAESTTDLISRHARDGTFLYASKAARDLLGYEPEELIGVSAYDLFHPSDLADLLNKSPRVYYHDGFYQQTYRFRAKDGHYVWFETTSRTRRDPASGELIDVLCVSRDVGRRIRAEANRERLARVVESTTDYVLFCDGDERLFYSNEAARRLLGLPREGLDARLERAYTPASLSILREIVLPAVARYGSWSGELEMPGPRGPVPVLSVVLAHRGPGAEPDHLSLLNRDIGLRKAAEAQARRHQEQIAHANRLATTGELASNIAHELNQPLGAIANYVSGALIQLRADPGRPARDLTLPLERIDAQVQRLGERLRHIRTFVRKGQTRPRPVALIEVVDAACRLCEWQYQQAGIALDHELEEALPRVQADPIALEQVLVNLLLNALEASRERPGATRVEIHAHRSGRREVTFRVSDQGPGISHDEAQAIFTPFHSSRPEGLGMGLAISRSLMEAMGGSLSLADGSDGATFTGTLLAEPSPSYRRQPPRSQP
ncbi:PAS domain S-box protein [Halomonas sp. MCCC 1A17488]|uniref:histidine kinase n=1 Tax=Billgrantia sulfidoxydans TaxID=2733484 RepID=A0ABX7W1U3_9GAMM|nr:MULTISPECIES: ATP-binding protein [Halomonas]MCE8015976.1 PAS domain S-box protein [Halomonas sp. MCCC 1A17488]MCG3239309.1 PAS domain S-box protein [Halomonas sp. MCCC 1A17488]QPP50759.1 PAS domain S-box protein [Halomonas sp. SS10-MC5]QTP54334.1 PAS domain S-box protein [Halomonas sulfidoxydans]